MHWGPTKCIARLMIINYPLLIAYFLQMLKQVQHD